MSEVNAIGEMTGVRVLIVDDDHAQRMLLTMITERIGITDVRSEADAGLVFDAVASFDPDIIMMDLHLVGGDAFAVIGHLSDQDLQFARRKIIIITGDTNPVISDRLNEAGVHAVVHKPFLVDDLIDVITRLVATAAEEDAEAPEPTTGGQGVAPTLQLSATEEAAHGSARRDTDDLGSAVRLVDVVRDLASAHTVADIVTLVRTAARQLTGADGATFILREGDQCHYVDEDAIAPLWKGKKFPMEACVSGWVMLHAQPAVIEDIYADERVPHDAYRSTFVQSLVMVPIRAAQPIGAIGNYWATTRQPTTEEVRLLQALADSTAVALENARLYAQLETSNDRATELSDANDQLREFVYAVAHDVRTPLSTIQGFADLVQSGRAAQSADNRDALDAIRAATTNLSNYVSDLLAFATADGRGLHAEVLALGDLIGEVTDRLIQPIRQRHAQVVVEQERDIFGDRVLLGQALQNLIANAIAYSPIDRDPVVRVAARDQGTGWELTVSDNGNGIPPSERQTIFDPFRRGSTGVHQHGTGLGLALCRRVAERHGGQIAVRESPDGGAEFVVSCPYIADPR